MMRIADLATHPEKYCTVKEVREYLHVSDSYVRKLADAGILEALRPRGPSRLVRISVDSVRRAFPELARSNN